MLGCELGREVALTSALDVEATAARSRGTVTRTSANEASGRPNFPTASKCYLHLSAKNVLSRC